MDEGLIKSIPRTPVIPDALKKREKDKKSKTSSRKKPNNRKDPKRIIDTYV